MSSRFLKDCIAVMLGGGLGALASFFMSCAIYEKPFPAFPITVLIINLSGCFLVGLLFSLFSKRISEFLKAFIFIGFFGSYTTFSNFAYQTNNLFLYGKINTALLNIAISVIVGIALFAFGFYLVKKAKN